MSKQRYVYVILEDDKDGYTELTHVDVHLSETIEHVLKVFHEGVARLKKHSPTRRTRLVLAEAHTSPVRRAVEDLKHALAYFILCSGHSSIIEIIRQAATDDCADEAAEMWRISSHPGLFCTPVHYAEFAGTH